MEKMVIFGHITFLEDEAIIHEVNEIKVMDEDLIDDYMVENHESFLIPCEYRGKLTIEN